MQESLLSPKELAEAADRAGLTGWNELARFAQEYLDGLAMVNQVDYAGLVQMGAAVVGDGPALFDHVLVDDYQDTTLAQESLLHGLATTSTVVAADPGAHVFSFQGSSAVPLQRFATTTFPGAARIELTHDHRAPDGRELRRLGQRAQLRGACGDRARAPPSPRRGRRRVGRPRGRHAAPGRAPREPVARARRRADPARGPGARAVADVGVGDLPLRAGAALAGRRPRPPRRADRAAADLGGGRALAGGGARPDAVGQDDGPDAARRRSRPRSDRRPRARRGGAGRTGARDPRQGVAVRGHVGAGRVQGPVGRAPVLGRARRGGRTRSSTPS